MSFSPRGYYGAAVCFKFSSRRETPSRVFMPELYLQLYNRRAVLVIRSGGKKKKKGAEFFA